MFERWIEISRTEGGEPEAAAAARQRLKAIAGPAASRRMTGLGLLVGGVLADLNVRGEDAVIYATGFAESRALEGFLDSFPTPSPTLFQTSIHPSAVQQTLIGRQQPLRELIPLSGSGLLVFHLVRAAFVSPAPRSIVCGGEERGTWLIDHGLASDRTFAFAAALSRARGCSEGCLRLTRSEGFGELGLFDWFEALRRRTPLHRLVAPGWLLDLEWF